MALVAAVLRGWLELAHHQKKMKAGKANALHLCRALCEIDPMKKPPKILDKMADLVLKYRPETKQKPPRKRKIDPKRQVKENKDKRELSM